MYTKTCRPLKIGEFLYAQIEPNNPVDEYAVCIQKSGKVVEHLKKGATGTFSKTIFFKVSLIGRQKQ